MSLLDGTFIKPSSSQIPWQYKTFDKTKRQSYIPLNKRSADKYNDNDTEMVCEFCKTTSTSTKMCDAEPTIIINEVFPRYHTCIWETQTPGGETGVFEEPYGILRMETEQYYLAVNVQFMICDDCHHKILEANRIYKILHPQNEEPYLTKITLGGVDVSSVDILQLP